MAASEVWNVYVPVSSLNTTYVYLTGQVDTSNKCLFVTHVNRTLANFEKDSVIGFLSSSHTNPTSPNSPIDERRQNVWLSVVTSKLSVSDCRVFINGKQCKCVCIVFNTKHLISSFIFTGEQEKSNHSTSRTKILLDVYGSYDVSSSRPTDPRSLQKGKSSIGKIFVLILYALTAVFSVVDWIVSVASIKWCWSRVCVQTPALLSNTSFKLKQLKKLKDSSTSSLHSKLVLFDVCSQQLLDSALGISVMVFLLNFGFANNIAKAVMHWADDTAGYLNDLLHWLMGAPAGLKLNAQLTEYMGHFFIYHVYLWSGYLSVLRPVLGWVIGTAAVFGVLGVSTQLCMVQDIVSMLTLHIYCFYVYAARIYSLQVYALSSLWRLFRGKKWNVLRLRVDSALYNIDQLCIGTLLFTVLLFLLPTTLLYYFVFMVLRLLVLSLHGVLTVVIETINTVPVATLILRCLRSKCVSGGLLFVVHNQEESEQSTCLTLSMQTTQLPLKKLYHAAVANMTDEPASRTHHKYSWSELFQKLASGHLIYPWVNPYDDNDSKEKVC